MNLIYQIVCGLLLVVISIIDIRKRIIPNMLVLFGFGWVLGSRATDIPALIDSALGLAVMFSCFMFIFWGIRKIGMGDIKLAALVGFMVGFSHIVLAVLLTGLITFIVACVYNERPQREVPYAPILAVSSILALVFGTPVMNLITGG